ncbi:response regulator [Marinomonas algarum]|uniref:Response regulator transcription factor n=1 Tax=Marinomonas algarum TaxID=2883105 RepID=A0A9X1IR90_9GAMM|nr:response regulator transcription factor [Marinomonas algarum]MCB5162826.1 response regulator transcription factor [Marinomonas algarum]
MTATKLINVIVVDDHPLFRRGVVDLLNEHPDFQVTADFDDGHEFLQHTNLLPIDLVLIDLHMPKLSGLALLKAIKTDNDSNNTKKDPLKVVIITASDDSSEFFSAIAGGADGYLLKDSDPNDIISKLHSVIEGNIALSPTGVTRLARHMSKDIDTLMSTPYQPTNEQTTIEKTVSEKNTAVMNNSSTSTLNLTERERQTLKLITYGMSNKLIARELGISDGTVKVYVKNLLRKLNLSSRLALAAWAHANADFPLE